MGPIGRRGTCFRTWDPHACRLVAVTVPTDGSDCDRFLTAARATSQLSHPHIVSIREVGEHAGIPFVATDFVQGHSFADLVRTRARMVAPQILLRVAQLCDALVFARDRGATHRPFEPELALVDRDGALKVLGIGIDDSGAADHADGLEDEDQLARAIGVALYDLLAVPAPQVTPASGTRRIPLVTVRPDLDVQVAALVDDWAGGMEALPSLNELSTKARAAADRLTNQQAVVRPSHGQEPLAAFRSQAEQALIDEGFEARIAACTDVSTRDPENASSLDRERVEVDAQARRQTGEREVAAQPRAEERVAARDDSAAGQFEHAVSRVAAMTRADGRVDTALTIDPVKPAAPSPPAQAQDRQQRTRTSPNRKPRVSPGGAFPPPSASEPEGLVHRAQAADRALNAFASEAALVSQTEPSPPPLAQTAPTGTTEATAAAPPSALAAEEGLSTSPTPLGPRVPLVLGGLVLMALVGGIWAAREPRRTPAVPAPTTGPVSPLADIDHRPVPAERAAPPAANGSASPASAVAREVARPQAGGDRPRPVGPIARARSAAPMPRETAATDGASNHAPADLQHQARAPQASGRSHAPPDGGEATAARGVAPECPQLSAIPRILICEVAAPPVATEAVEALATGIEPPLSVGTTGTSTTTPLPTGPIVTLPAEQTPAGSAADSPTRPSAAATQPSAPPSQPTARATTSGTPTAALPRQRGVRDPVLATFVRPIYPESAKQSGTTGDVEVELTIDERGRVVFATAISGPMVLRAAAESALLQWRYDPASVDGRPVASGRRLRVTFSEAVPAESSRAPRLPGAIQ